MKPCVSTFDGSFRLPDSEYPEWREFGDESRRRSRQP